MNHLKPKPEKCPKAGFYLSYILHSDTGDRFITSLIGCNKWACPICGKKLAYKLKTKLKNGIKKHHDLIEKSGGFTTKYYYKFLTLTVPGEYYRSIYTIEESEQHLKTNFNKLRTALVKRFGRFEYNWVIEPQQDGYPHMHVVLIGDPIAPITVLNYIKKLWVYKYHMGFVKLKWKKSLAEVINYQLKYITKGLSSGRIHARVWSCSRNLRQLMKTEKPNVTILEYGKIVVDRQGKECKEMIWSAYGSDGRPPPYIEEIFEDLWEWSERNGINLTDKKKGKKK